MNPVGLVPGPDRRDIRKADAMRGSIRNDDVLTHDETAEDPTLAYLLSRFAHDNSPKAVNPFPEPVGVYRTVRKPTYEEQLDGRIAEAIAKKGKGTIEDLFKAEDVWTVE